jgi:hypothetical protein
MIARQSGLEALVMDIERAACREIYGALLGLSADQIAELDDRRII